MLICVAGARIVVYDLVVTPGDVRLNRGPGARVSVERASHVPRLADRTLAVDGQFVSIDEGNRARRMEVMQAAK